VHDILIRARELISDPAHWVQGSYTGDGPVTDPDTKCFCLAGAVDRAVIEKRGWLDKFTSDDQAILDAEFDPEGSAAITALQKLVEPNFWRVSDFNDDPATLHEDVLALLDKAIAQ
jgi:hypothetical protein